jgi:hypothetical protein
MTKFGSSEENAPFWYADVDADGYGDARSSQTGCTQPSGFVSGNTDCDDGDATVNPGSVDVWDGIDNDCDGVFDEDCTSRSIDTKYPIEHTN